ANPSSIAGTTRPEARNISWSSDVVISSGPTPELIVNSSGDVVRATNITVNGIANPAVGAHLTGPNNTDDITVGDIVNDDTGDIVMESKDGTITETFTDTSASKYWSTFFYKENFDEVRITNESPGRLILNTINVVDAARKPRVELRTKDGTGSEDQGKTVSMRFDLIGIATPSLIDIKNLSNSDIILKGTGHVVVGSVTIDAAAY